MKVAQIYDLVNTVTSEVLGKENLVNEDLSNVVEIGKEIVDSDSIDNYVKSLVNHIGKVVFNDRLYNGGVPSVLMDSWEYGSILEKITAELPEAEESDSWALEDKKSYDPNIFYQPKVTAKFFNHQVTFDIPLSFTENQVKESFSDVNQLNGFLSMLKTSIQNSMTIKTESLIMRTINNMTAQTLLTLPQTTGTNPTIDYSKSTVKAVNLLADYNAKFGTTLTPDKALSDKDFIKYSSFVISLYEDRISKISTLFNIGAKARFTPKDSLHLVLLSEFATASNVYLESDTYHNENVQLPNYETVPYWQASGTNYKFDDVSAINVKTATTDGKGATVTAKGILGVMFDTNACGVSNTNQRVTTNYNAKAEFYTNFYKFDCGYYNDMNENFVVFFVA